MSIKTQKKQSLYERERERERDLNPIGSYSEIQF